MFCEIFVDWLTASQHHPKGGLPIVTAGLNIQFDASGVPRFERNCSASIAGSHDTSLRVGCDGFRVSLSGNVGRYGRQDNVFNYGLEGTIRECNRVLVLLGLPIFTASIGIKGHADFQRGAVVSRLDITANYATGGESQARHVIRWLAARSISRMKRGQAGDESVWWSNTRHMFKGYIKHLEMLAHGTGKENPVYQWCKEQGVVRVEIELKKRLLSDLGLNDLGELSQEKLIQLFGDQTEILKSVDKSSEVDFMDSLPVRSRVYASAWLAGQDLRDMVGSATLYRHAKVLREYGIDILQMRNVEQFPVKVRIIEMQPLVVPDWYVDLQKVA